MLFIRLFRVSVVLSVDLRVANRYPPTHICGISYPFIGPSSVVLSVYFKYPLYLSVLGRVENSDLLENSDCWPNKKLRFINKLPRLT